MAMVGKYFINIMSLKLGDVMKMRNWSSEHD